MVISIYSGSIIIFNLVMIYFAAKVIKQFSESEWKVKAFEFGVILLASLLIINSISIVAVGTITEAPIRIEKEGYENVARLSGIILYDPTEGNILEYYTELTPFAKSEDTINAKISSQIFYSSILDLTLSLIEENQISYVMIDEDMVEKYWNNQERGLLIMVHNQEHFKIIHSDQHMQVYEVITIDSQS